MPPRKNSHGAPAFPMTAVQDVPDLRDWPFEPSLVQLRRYVTPPRGLTILEEIAQGIREPEEA